MRLLQNINKTNTLELHFGLSITEQQYINLENILTNPKTLMYNIIRTYFDDEDNTVMHEEIRNITTNDLLHDKYKQVEILDKEEIANNKILYKLDETELTPDIIEYYEAGIFDITKQNKAITYNIILETGIQGYLSKVESILVDSVNTNITYVFIIDFNTKIIPYYKLEKLVEKYTKKINFYFNIGNIMRSKLQQLFKTKYIPEQNRILNKPATLERKDIPKIALNYTITDKADGIRYLLIIDKYSTGYLIGNKFEIQHIFTNPIKGINDCILDGEYIEQPADEPNKFLIFDILQYNGKSLLKRPFIERMKYLNQLVENKNLINKKHQILYNGQKQLHISIKQFYMLKDFLDKVAGDIDTPEKIISYPFLSVLPRDKYISTMIDLWSNRSTKFTYLLDGLILTPLNGLYIPENRSFLIYKWKDIHTIDVRLVEDKKDDTIWHFDVSRNDKPDIIEGYTFDESKQGTTGSDIPLTNGIIVEFMWSEKEKQFIPLRVREDKVKPNTRLTVESVIQAINDNIHVEELFDLSKAIPEFGDAFYQEKNMRKKEREESLDINFKKFHNYIKNELILYPGEFGQRGVTLLDLAAGKGGDIHKWQHAGYTEILACDITATALEEFSKRIKKLKKKKNNKMNITLANTDSTKRLITGQAGLTNEEQHHLRNYFTIIHPAMKFSKVVCNFAISYMFSEEDPIANGFFTNIAETLSKVEEDGITGYFVGTMIDGNLLDKAFITEGKKEIIAKINDEIFYTIKPVGDYKLGSLNNKILVARPGRGGWANPIPEPVIYPESIITSAQTMGLRVIEFKGFEEYYKDFKDKETISMSSGEKQISFLHKTFVIGW
jgi:SAM-dependent methyltransferase